MTWQLFIGMFLIGVIPMGVLAYAVISTEIEREKRNKVWEEVQQLRKEIIEMGGIPKA